MQRALADKAAASAASASAATSAASSSAAQNALLEAQNESHALMRRPLALRLYLAYALGGILGRYLRAIS